MPLFLIQSRQAEALPPLPQGDPIPSWGSPSERLLQTAWLMRTIDSTSAVEAIAQQFSPIWFCTVHSHGHPQRFRQSTTAGRPPPPDGGGTAATGAATCATPATAVVATCAVAAATAAVATWALPASLVDCRTSCAPCARNPF